MSDYKLVVVTPFNDFKKGDQIFDPEIINKISNVDDSMSEFQRHCRKVLKSSVERQMYVAPVPENTPPEETPDTKELEHIEVESSEPIRLETIKPFPTNDDAA